MSKRKKPIDLETTCSFCEEDATTKYQRTYFCWDHVLRFYLGLKYTGWID